MKNHETLIRRYVTIAHYIQIAIAVSLFISIALVFMKQPSIGIRLLILSIISHYLIDMLKRYFIEDIKRHITDHMI